MKLYFFPKIADNIINAVTFVLLVFHILDLILRSIVEPKYFPYFFFWADVICVFFIVASAIITSISLWITLSFLKILMVLKVTKIILTYKEFRWSRKMWAWMKKEQLNWVASN